MNEFELIDRFFRRPENERPEVLLGMGDDAAVLAPSRQAMVVCTDSLVCGVHFSASDPPADIGFKCLAVNLSDLAAMGAEPLWAMMNLTIPDVDENWLGEFSRGFDDLARRYDVALVGGDTTHGALTISVQAGGRVPPGRELRRSGAREGHKIFLSSPVGDGVLGLDVAQGRYHPSEEDASFLLNRLRRPEPAVRAGLELRGIAAAAIDVSDGLLADLEHVLGASGGLGAELELSDAWFSRAARNFLAAGGDPARLLAGGDDYVLLFTVDPDILEVPGFAFPAPMGEPVPVGTVVAQPGVRVHDSLGRRISCTGAGFQHFGGGATDVVAGHGDSASDGTSGRRG